jgi:hypothetical protein
LSRDAGAGARSSRDEFRGHRKTRSILNQVVIALTAVVNFVAKSGRTVSFELCCGGCHRKIADNLILLSPPLFCICACAPLRGLTRDAGYLTQSKLLNRTGFSIVRSQQIARRNMKSIFARLVAGLPGSRRIAA